jgi:hypothetical protein
MILDKDQRITEGRDGQKRGRPLGKEGLQNLCCLGSSLLGLPTCFARTLFYPFRIKGSWPRVLTASTPTSCEILGFASKASRDGTALPWFDQWAFGFQKDFLGVGCLPARSPKGLGVVSRLKRELPFEKQ